VIESIIIDDEPSAIETLSGLLAQHCPLIKIAGHANSVESGVTAVKAHQPQLIFLDVEMPPLTGFDLLDQLSPFKFDVIFTTAYDEYAIKAFRFSAIDYLLKPISISELQGAVNKVASKTALVDAPRLEVLKNNLKNDISLRQITLPTSKGYVFEDVKNIIRCEADDNYTKFYFAVFLQLDHI